MGTSADLYIRASSSEEVLQLRAIYPEISFQQNANFATLPVDLNIRATPESVLHIAQRRQREVIYIFFSGGSDSLQYTRCTPAKVCRHLQYGMFVEQGVWEEVLGEPEPWESAAFFPKSMILRLDSSQSEDWKRRQQEIFDRGYVVQGESDHLVDAPESARAAALFYRLSGWL